MRRAKGRNRPVGAVPQTVLPAPIPPQRTQAPGSGTDDATAAHFKCSACLMHRQTCGWKMVIVGCPVPNQTGLASERNSVSASVSASVLCRLVIADDHPLFRGALREAVTGLFQRSEIAEAGCFDDISMLLDRADDIDLLLLDLTMPGVRGFSGLMYMRAQYPGVPVVIVSANDDPAVIRRCMDFGASGFIPKTSATGQIREAIEAVLRGGVWTPPDIDLAAERGDDNSAMLARLASLTPQQVRVLTMLSEGLLNKQIAYELAVSEATVKAHVSAILQKLGVESRTQAVIVASKIEVGQRSQVPPITH
jgi:DNA-binding NarL/FixJ family response regulator